MQTNGFDLRNAPLSQQIEHNLISPVREKADHIGYQ